MTLANVWSVTNGPAVILVGGFVNSPRHPQCLVGFNIKAHPEVPISLAVLPEPARFVLRAAVLKPDRRIRPGLRRCGLSALVFLNSDKTSRSWHGYAWADYHGESLMAGREG